VRSEHIGPKMDGSALP